MYTYIIRLGDTNYYKIGRSKNVAKRLKSLQTANPIPLVLVHTFTFDCELFLHRQFSAFKKRNEWFELTYTQIYSTIHNYAALDVEEIYSRTKHSEMQEILCGV